MSVCISTKCKKYDDCARAAVNNREIYVVADKASYTFIKLNNKGQYIQEYWCGEKGNYRLFIDIHEERMIE